MSCSFSVSETASFTITHARHMASKVATDLKRIQRFYGAPSDEEIADYEAEITLLLKDNLLGTVTYGFKRDGLWIEPTLKYSAHDLIASSATDNDPGRIRANADISGAVFASFLTYSNGWSRLSESERETFRSKLPFRRTTGSEPGVNGYLSKDLTYSSGGRALERATVRSFS